MMMHLVDAFSFEDVLEDLLVGDVFILVLGVQLDPCHRDVGETRDGCGGQHDARRWSP